MVPRLILTADDYGLTEAVNAGIEACLAGGAVQSTCIMSNMPFFARGGALKEKFPEISVGIHWTLTVGRPVLAAAQVPSLVGGNGEFVDFVELRRRLKAGKVNFAEVQAELQAQYRRFREVCATCDYWNTHENVHLWPGLFQCFVKVGRECQIPAMRSNSRRTICPNPAWFSLTHPLYFAKGLWISRWASMAKSQGMRLPDGLIIMPGYGPGKAKLLEALERGRKLGAGSVSELTLHPALDGDNPLYGRLGKSRIEEYHVFREPTLKTKLGELGYACASFATLNG